MKKTHHTAESRAACRRLAKTIIDAATEMGLDIVDSYPGGAHSSSHYIIISSGNESVRVRVADHPGIPYTADVQAYASRSATQPIKKIAKLLGIITSDERSCRE